MFIRDVLFNKLLKSTFSLHFIRLSHFVCNWPALVCFGPVCFKSPACIGMHANVHFLWLDRHLWVRPYAVVCVCCLGMCVYVGVAPSPTLTGIHSLVAWHPEKEFGSEKQRLRYTVRTLLTDSILAVCLAQIRSTLMNIQQLAIATRIVHILTKPNDGV